MNENLRRALLRARLTDEDVAARLEVDPKTVRRWLEGRTPYLRHRWALAGLLGLDEADLWPEIQAARAARSRPPEIRAIYSSLEAIPGAVWEHLFASAKEDIGVFEDSSLSVANDDVVLRAITEKARAGVRVRICIHHSDRGGSAASGNDQAKMDTAAAIKVRDVLDRYRPLRDIRGAKIRIYSGDLYQSAYRADSQILIAQHAYGIASTRAPVLHLRGAGDGYLVIAYLDSLERIWANAVPVA